MLVVQENKAVVVRDKVVVVEAALISKAVVVRNKVVAVEAAQVNKGVVVRDVLPWKLLLLLVKKDKLKKNPPLKKV